MRQRGGVEMTDARGRLRKNSTARGIDLSTTTAAFSDIAGVDVDNVSEDDAIAAIERLVDAGGSHYAAVVNAAKIVAATKDDKLKRILLEADLVTADGMSVVWASRFLGNPLKQRVTGIDLFERLVARSAALGWAVYFLGARDESVGGTVEHFTNLHPELRVAGYRNGFFEASKSAEVAGAIRDSSADLLFVALGSPAQEYWIAENVGLTGVRLALGVGGSFDHVSGLARRAPEWMRRSGLEWLYRLVREPRRLWRRYLIGNSIFLWLIIRQRFSAHSE